MGPPMGRAGASPFMASPRPARREGPMKVSTGERQRAAGRGTGIGGSPG